MSLQKLDIYNVRNIQKTSLQPSPTLNFIYGRNGSGKSSLLEAIFILGRARSYRTNYLKQAISFDQNELIVSGQTLLDEGRHCQLGVQFTGKDYEIRINHLSNQSRHRLASALPIQLIDPKSYQLLDSGPQHRREFVDWGVFNYSEHFLPAWRNYKKALNQRNALLKLKRPSQLEVWNQELLNYGTIIADCRRVYIDLLEPVFNEIVHNFLQINSVVLNPFQGWDLAKGFDRSLIDDVNKDLKYGFTHSGPHRSDLYVSTNNGLVKDFVSRGQLKLIVLALKLAQVKLIAMNQVRSGCILIDDFTAELDSANRDKLIQQLLALNFQVFMTATERDEFGDLKILNNHKMFHVEQGQVKQV